MRRAGRADGAIARRGQLRSPRPGDTWEPSLCHGLHTAPPLTRWARARGHQAPPPPRGPAPRGEVPPRGRPRVEPAEVHSSRAPWFRAGAAQARFWTVGGQQTPSRVFKETLERGGLWGIKFPGRLGLIRACVRSASPRGAESVKTVGGIYGACAEDPRLQPSKFEAHFPARPALVGASVELVSRPVRLDPRMPPG